MSDEQRWLDALTSYEGLTMGRRKVELTSIIRPIVERLQQEVATVEGLQTHYRSGDEWWLEIARDGYPNQPHLWEKSRTADVAYGIRYTQLTSKQPGSPIAPHDAS